MIGWWYEIQKALANQFLRRFTKGFTVGAVDKSKREVALKSANQIRLIVNDLPVANFTLLEGLFNLRDVRDVLDNGNKVIGQPLIITDETYG